ncbi:MAG: XRE family transcriptional regulator [Treponema sp.]|jgi:SOS-response transcriptional repressor LexA|nr:XRE family transcriptional regulator [Treponema sp.]
MDLAQVLTDLRKNSGKSQREFAEMLGIPQTTWSGYERGQTRPKMDVFLSLAEKGYTIKGINTSSIDDWPEVKKQELQRRLDIIKTGAFDLETPLTDIIKIIKAVDDHPSPYKKTSEIPIYNYGNIENIKNAFVIPLLNQKLSAGNGQELPNDDEVSALIPVPSSLAKFGKNLAALTVEGDSMYPTLERGDLVVCDSYGWSGEGIYALRMGGDGFVKRITKAPGKIVIISDNPKYPTREEPEESQDFDIIGRVHYAIKNME